MSNLTCGKLGRTIFLLRAELARVIFMLWAASVWGSVINQGDRTVTGFAIKIEYMKKGKMIGRAILTETEEIMPATYQQFDHTKRSLKGCDEVSVDIVDFAIKE